MLARASSVDRNRPRIKERRREQRRVFIAGLVVAGLLFGGGITALLRSDALRITAVSVAGGPDDLAAIAQETLQGAYLGIIPRNSIVFFPEAEIRSKILSHHPEYAALGITRSGLHTLTLRVSQRVAIARWCGDFAPQNGAMPSCYLFDANGLIFAAASSTALDVVNAYALYAPRQYGDAVTGDANPVGTTLASADHLPTIFDFVRQTQLLEQSRLGQATTTGLTSAVVIHDGEVDTYLDTGTRISYVLGNEQAAYTALVSAGEALRLGDPSIAYVDLRFDGRVYVKRRGE